MLILETDNKNREIQEGIKSFLELVPPYRKNKPIYAVTGGFGVELHSGAGRTISDLDILLLEKRDPEEFYKDARKKTGHDEKVNNISIDIQDISKPVFGSVKLNKIEAMDNIVEKEYMGMKVPVMSKEFISVCKLTSVYNFESILRNKDIVDVMNMDLMSFDEKKILDLISKSKTVLVNPKTTYFILEKGSEIYRQNPANGIRVLKYMRKYDDLLDNNPARKEELFAEIAKHIVESDDLNLIQNLNRFLNDLKARGQLELFNH